MKQNKRARSKASSSPHVTHTHQRNEIGRQLMSNPLHVTPRRKLRDRVQSDEHWSYHSERQSVRVPGIALFPFILFTLSVLSAGEHEGVNHLAKRHFSDDIVDLNNFSLAEDDKRRYNFCGSRLVRESSLIFLSSIQGKRTCAKLTTFCFSLV